MKAQDFFVILIYSVALFATFKVLMFWWNGRINTSNAWEWFLRGFFMAWGFITCFFVVLFIVKLTVGFK